VSAPKARTLSARKFLELPTKIAGFRSYAVRCRPLVFGLYCYPYEAWVANV